MKHLGKHNMENMLYAGPCHRVIDARHIQLVPDYFESIPLKQELPNEKLRTTLDGITCQATMAQALLYFKNQI